MRFLSLADPAFLGLQRLLFILDQIGAPSSAAYSLRKLRTAYAGSAIRVRRSSDNAELDIGFTASGDLDTTLLAFVGTGDGFITTWYDQSGNGRNATQTDSTRQPRIVSNGVIETQNGLPTVVQTAIDQSLPINSAFTGMTSATGVFVFRQLVNTGVGSGAHGFRMNGGNSTNNNHSPVNGVNALDGFFSANRMQFNNYGPSTTLTTHTVRQTGTALQLFKNGTQIDGDKTVAFATYATEKALLMDANPNGTIALSEGFVFGTAISTTDRQLIERNQGEYYGILVLAVAPSTAAYSLRKVRNAYAGSAIRVRRSSDNAELEIGFTASGDLDTAALLAFVGGGNGFVTTWYDQSGNGRNATQATAGSQPQIVASGAVITMNGRPTLRFDGNDILNTPSFMLGNTVVTVARRSSRFECVVEGANVVSQDRGLWGLRSGTTDFTTHLNYGINGSPLNDTNADGFPMNVLQIVSQTVAKGTVATNSSIWRIGGGGGGYVPLNGFISEMVAISSLLSTTDRQLIERNQGQFYGISIT
jgi:hypothetical protein